MELKIREVNLLKRKRVSYLFGKSPGACTEFIDLFLWDLKIVSLCDGFPFFVLYNIEQTKFRRTEQHT